MAYIHNHVAFVRPTILLFFRAIPHCSRRRIYSGLFLLCVVLSKAVDELNSKGFALKMVRIPIGPSRQLADEKVSARFVVPLPSHFRDIESAR